MTEVVLAGRVLAPGTASGPGLTLSAPLSLWGGIDPGTGLIIDQRHPEAGMSVAGLILMLPAVRGSSSSSSVLAELLRAGVGPLGIVLGRPDEILTIGSLVAAELYGAVCPVVLVGPTEYTRVAGAAELAIAPDGRITVLGATTPPASGSGSTGA